MNKEKIKKIYLIVIGVFVVLATSFYFLVGDKLWYKASKNSITMLEANAISDEINNKTSLTQTFISKVDRIESFSFIFTKNYSEGLGKLNIDISLNSVSIANQTFDIANDVPEQSRINVILDKPINDAKNKNVAIKISSTSKPGEGVHAMMVSGSENASLLINNRKTEGSICFSMDGYDDLWIGPYYWYIAIGFCLLLSACLYYSYKNYLKGKQDYIIIAIIALDKYKFLISQLVSRDFKSKYKRSVFGVFWSFLNPLLTMIVQFLVFSTIFRVDTQNYPVYLISGVVCFSFFNECTTMCLNSISGNSRLITKVYIPKYIFPLSKTISSSVNLAISMVPLLLVAIVTGTQLRLSFLLIFYFLACLIVFSLGIGMILATLMVFFRDIQFIWSVLITIWQYATPIFYPAEIIPEKYRFIVRFNPLYHFIGNARKCLIDGVSPEPISYVYCFVFALAALAIGSYVFKKSQDKFTLYL